MKYTIVIALSFALSACSLFSPKKAPEVVASCFSDGEDQTKMCKAQRTDEESRVVVTRCIGSQNREANPILRGKCVEKICSEGSNTDCVVKGEIRVLEQYADLVTSNMFGDGEGGAPAPKKHMSAKERKAAMRAAKLAAAQQQHPPQQQPAAAVAVASAASAPSASSNEVDTDPSVALPQMPEKKVAEEKPAPAPAPSKAVEEPAEAPQVAIALKPLKGAKRKAAIAANNRALANIKTTPASSVASADEGGFKKVCVAKNDSGAPEVLRGKCATRSCSANGKCSYKGRKEMFDYVARSEAG